MVAYRTGEERAWNQNKSGGLRRGDRVVIAHRFLDLQSQVQIPAVRLGRAPVLNNVEQSCLLRFTQTKYKPFIRLGSIN